MGGGHKSITQSKDNSKKGIDLIVAKYALLGVITAAVITAIGAIISAYISRSNAPVLQPTIVSRIVFYDAFDNSNGSYDTNQWICDNECNIDFVTVKDGVLSLQRDIQGYTNLLSNDTWDNANITSISGDVQMSTASKYSVLWFGLNELAGCEIDGGEFTNPPLPTPYIQCYFGEIDEKTGKHYFTTTLQPVGFDTWHNIKIDFDKTSNTYSFYIDRKFVEKYSPPREIRSTRVDLGIWVENDENIPLGVKANGQVYIDNISVYVK